MGWLQVLACSRCHAVHRDMSHSRAKTQLGATPEVRVQLVAVGRLGAEQVQSSAKFGHPDGVPLACIALAAQVGKGVVDEVIQTIVDVGGRCPSCTHRSFSSTTAHTVKLAALGCGTLISAMQAWKDAGHDVSRHLI